MILKVACFGAKSRFIVSNYIFYSSTAVLLWKIKRPHEKLKAEKNEFVFLKVALSLFLEKNIQFKTK